MPSSVLTPEVERRTREENQETIRRLVQQLRSPLGVIPFIGAGISSPMGFPQWSAFLRFHAGKLDPADREPVERTLASGNLEEAAALIERSLEPEEFQKALEESFGDHRLADANLSVGRLPLLVLLTSGPVITTNFDRLLEKAFHAAGRPFEGPVLGANPHEVVPALQQNRNVLWKVHGDWGDRRTRVLTEGEYQEHYVLLEQMLWLALTNRPALFLGCSLDQDWTVKVLAAIQKQHKGITQYAIVEAPLGEAEFGRRAKQLHHLGISPIWYPEGRYEEVEQRLSELVNRSSSSPLSGASKSPGSRASEGGSLQAAGLKLQEEIAGLQEARETLAAWPGSMGLGDTLPYAPMLQQIARGELAFFLGAGACLGRLPLSRGFYEHLAATFNASGLEMEPPRIAQLFDDRYGRPALFEEVDKLLTESRPAPTAVHWFLATLQGRLREKGYKPLPLLLLTTNYDNLMEQALDQAGEPYHLFFYRAGEPHRGAFIYRSPNGNECVIDRPGQFRRIAETGTILVKFHGGLHPPSLPLPVTYVFTQQDFVALAGRVPGAVPSVILDRLDLSSLLFLGHGLGDDSIEALVRQLNQRQPRRRSWAVQLHPNPSRRVYWKELGVEIFDTSLESTILELDHRVEGLRPVLGRQS